MGWKIATFFTALNRALFIRFSHVASVSSSSFQGETIAREEGGMKLETCTNLHTCLQLLVIFRNDEKTRVRFPMRENAKEKFVNKNPAQRPLDACYPTRLDVAFVSLSLLCRDNSRDFPRVVIFLHLELSLCPSYLYPLRKNFANGSRKRRAFYDISFRSLCLERKFDWERAC